MTDIMDFRSKEALTHYLVRAAATGAFALPELRRDEFINVLFQITSQIHVSDAALAARWDCSVPLLQKMRRIGTGPNYLKLSAGLIRHSLLDVVSYEAAVRISPIPGGR